MSSISGLPLPAVRSVEAASNPQTPSWVVRHHRVILGILFVLELLLNLIRNVRV
jgi:hypothetical protein